MRRLAITVVFLLGLNSAAAQSGDETVRAASSALRAQQYDQAYQAAHAGLPKAPSDPKF
jgi:hypothetical protein